jgi:hypothetical protein
MADVTLERIAELRALAEKLRTFHGTGDSAGFAKVSAEIALAFRMNAMPLLDAAERGLTGDRKAAAFDALDAMLATGRVTLKRPLYNRDLRIVDYVGSRVLVYHVDQLVDGIEQVDRMLKEPSDG